MVLVRLPRWHRMRDAKLGIGCLVQGREGFRWKVWGGALRTFSAAGEDDSG